MVAYGVPDEVRVLPVGLGMVRSIAGSGAKDYGEWPSLGVVDKSGVVSAQRQRHGRLVRGRCLLTHAQSAIQVYDAQRQT
ncbi:hypothetical protein D3C81_1643100 [compost metagenome]